MRPTWQTRARGGLTTAVSPSGPQPLVCSYLNVIELFGQFIGVYRTSRDLCQRCTSASLYTCLLLKFTVFACVDVHQSVRQIVELFSAVYVPTAQVAYVLVCQAAPEWRRMLAYHFNTISQAYTVKS